MASNKRHIPKRHARSGRIWRVVLILALVVTAGFWTLRAESPATATVRTAMAGLVQLGVVWPPAPEPRSNPQNDREQLLVEAHALLGTPYEWGAKGPDAYDCRGQMRLTGSD
jgi:cell wall-associated NlpC family hydrolase